MKPVRNYLTPDETENLLVRTSEKRDKLLFQMGLVLGCRVSEIVSLRLLDIEGRSAKVWDEKKDQYRLSVIDTDTEDLLADYLSTDYAVPQGVRKEHQTLFYLSQKTVNRRLKEAFGRAGVSRDVPWRWHTLRHTYVRRTLDLMGPRGIQFVCEQTGDTPATILKFYGVPSITDRLEAVDQYSVIPGVRLKKGNSETPSSQRSNMEGGL